jgi:hypothetical protein
MKKLEYTAFLKFGEGLQERIMDKKFYNIFFQTDDPAVAVCVIHK